LTLGQEPACCDAIQQRVPAVPFRNAQVIRNCIVSPKIFGFQIMKAKRVSEKTSFHMVAFSSFCGRFAMRGVPQKAPGDVPGQPWGVGWQVVPFLFIFGHLFGHLLAPLGSGWLPRAHPRRPPGHLWHHFCGPLDTNDAKSGEKLGFLDSAKMSVFPW